MIPLAKEYGDSGRLYFEYKCYICGKVSEWRLYPKSQCSWCAHYLLEYLSWHREHKTISVEKYRKIKEGLEKAKVRYEFKEKLKNNPKLEQELKEEKIRLKTVDAVWRKSVYERDKYTCQECGAKEYLQAHHIKLKSEFPELRNDVDNGITLCFKCHDKKHPNVKMSPKFCTRTHRQIRKGEH